MFRFQAKNVFLTYPRLDLAPAILLAHIKKLVACTYVIVSRELHEDGHPHLHAYASFQAKLRTSDCAFFDLDGHHPNIQSARNVADVINYIKKDGDFLEDGTAPDTTWSTILAVATDKNDFLARVKSRYPRDFVLQWDRLNSFADANFKTVVPPYVPQFTDFKVPLDLEYWADWSMKEDRPPTLHLFGPSRTGKTEWARSLGTHMYFNAYFNLDDWNAEADYIIFDDIPWDKIPAKKAFFGAQKTFVLTDKYRRKQTVNWGKPLIFLTNYDNNPFFEMPWQELQWYKDNMVQVEIIEKLY